MATESTRQLTFRLPEELIARVESCVSVIQERSGFSITRADVVRMLITRALDEAGHDLQRLFPARTAKPRSRRRV